LIYKLKNYNILIKYFSLYCDFIGVNELGVQEHELERKNIIININLYQISRIWQKYCYRISKQQINYTRTKIVWW